MSRYESFLFLKVAVVVLARFIRLNLTDWILIVKCKSALHVLCLHLEKTVGNLRAGTGRILFST